VHRSPSIVVVKKISQRRDLKLSCQAKLTRAFREAKGASDACSVPARPLDMIAAELASHKDDNR